MWTLFGNNKSQNRLSRRGHIICAALILIGFCLIASASRALYSDYHEDSAARDEYDRLRGLFHMAVSSQPSGYRSEFIDSPTVEQEEPQYPSGSLFSQDINCPSQPDPLVSLVELNPDFIGWIAIGDIVDYPVVRGYDNSFYLSITFTGNSNPAGTIFMDYRLAQGFNVPVCILYGHNMRDGSMFAQLNRYLEPEFMADHPDIAITTLEGETLLYRVIAARRTDMRDRAYAFDFQEDDPVISSGGTDRYLLLSTCTPGPDKDERLLVYAALVM